MKATHAVLFALLPLAVACTAPTLAQRQDNWRRFRDSARVTCVVGQADPAMPTEVRAWCAEVVAP